MKGRDFIMESKKLVVFYSYTGHTKYIAEMIKEKLNCDVLEIKLVKPYSKDYDLVVEEYQNNERMKETPPIEEIGMDLKKYNKIIVGSPVWWYTITPPIRTFLKENDLSGKIVIPFATNAGWLGRTFKEIEELCPNSNIEKEMNIVFTEDHTINDLVTKKEEIENWIDSL